MLKAVLFDMDGVLVDSESEYKRIEAELVRSVGVTLTDEEIESHVGRTTLDVWNGLKEKYGFSDDPYKLAETETQMIIDYCSSGMLRPIEPAVRLLKNCTENGLKIAVATSAVERNAAIVIKRIGLEKYVGAVASGDRIKNSKPAPDIFLLAAKLLGVKPEECVVIEDAKNGVLAAKAAGMKAIGFKAPESKQDLSKADIVVDSLDIISVETLEKLLGA